MFNDIDVIDQVRNWWSNGGPWEYIILELEPLSPRFWFIRLSDEIFSLFIYLFYLPVEEPS